MLSNTQNLIRQGLLNTGVHVSPTTDPEKLGDFFERVRPYETNHRLIRIGGELDGSYLLPDDLEGIGACYSPGVADRATFESDLAGRGIRCFMADYSVDGPPVQNALFHFQKKFLGPSDNSIYMTLESWMRESADRDTDLILQMDIEGSEYGVIFDTSPEALRRFRIIVIEFHGLHALCDKFGFELIQLSFMKLLKDFEVVHIHPNNHARPVHLGPYEIPPILEFTFLRKDRIAYKTPATAFPHPLDRTSYLPKRDFSLPGCWFGPGLPAAGGRA